MFPPVKRPVPHPALCAPAHLTAGQLVQKDTVRDSMKSLTKIQRSHIHRLPFTHQAGDLLVEGHQVGETGLSLCDDGLGLMTALSLKGLCIAPRRTFAFISPGAEVTLPGLESPGSSQEHSMAMVQSCIRAGSDLTFGSISLPRGWADSATGCLERWSMPCACQCLKNLHNALNFQLLVIPGALGHLA